MKKNIRTVFNIVLSAVLIFSLAKLALNTRDDMRSRQEFDQAVQTAFSSSVEAPAAPEAAPESSAEPMKKLPDAPVIKELLALDLDALREENKDVIGWIHIPDTRINYPLLQGTDNAFYLSHTWKKNANPTGSVFMDCQNDSDFSQFNTIIYGHNLVNEDMFGSLHHYRKAEYMQQHPHVYIASDAGVFRYDVFAAGFVGTNTIVYGLNIESEENKEAFLRYVQDKSSAESGSKPTIEDSFITLSTCTDGDKTRRMAVIAVLNTENSYERPTSLNELSSTP